MKVSIIIPVFNVSNYIASCVESALNQTHKNLEVIIIDDCGSDESMNVVMNVVESHPRNRSVQVIKHKVNQGLSAARNTGIEYSSGTYLYFLDGDDEISIDCIELMVAKISLTSSDFVIADYKVVGTKRKYPPLNLQNGLIDSNNQILQSFIRRDWFMMAFNKLINKSFLIDNQLYFKEGIVHEDELWSFMLACKASKMYVIKKETYVYKIREGSITQAPTINNQNSLPKIIEGMTEYVNKHAELTTSPVVYNFFEEMKSFYFYDVLSTSRGKKYEFSFYKKIRKSNYLKTFFPFKTHKMNFARTIRNLHYILPPHLGFVYYKTLLKLKKSQEKKRVQI